MPLNTLDNVVSDQSDLSLEHKYAILVDTVKKEIANRPLAVDHSYKANTRAAALHLLGLIYGEQKDRVAEQETWRELLIGNNPWQPNLAALSN